MLILTRRFGEGINIGDDIFVRIISGNAGQVRIGIDAPKNVSVHREEIYRKVLDERELLKQMVRINEIIEDTAKVLETGYVRI